MKTNHLNLAALAAGTSTLIASASPAAEAASVEELIANIKNPDDRVRGPAWQGAAPYGAPAVKPLAAVMSDPNFEVARAAKRGLYKIVRHAGRPGAEAEAKAVTTELIALLPKSETVVRREAVWMLSEIGGEEAIGPMAALLTDKEVREDARCALVRMPGDKATAALQSALSAASDDFKPALADGLRARGVKVEGIPSRKLTPTKQTNVKPAKTT
jgi:HEAT repeat protein